MILDPITARDYDTLFNYFVGARGNHAVHTRALAHAGFIVEADPDNSRKSHVLNPQSNERIGVILGEPEAVVGKYKPAPKLPEPADPAEPPGKVAG